MGMAQSRSGYLMARTFRAAEVASHPEWTKRPPTLTGGKRLPAKLPAQRIPAFLVGLARMTNDRFSPVTQRGGSGAAVADAFVARVAAGDSWATALLKSDAENVAVDTAPGSNVSTVIPAAHAAAWLAADAEAACAMLIREWMPASVQARRDALAASMPPGAVTDELARYAWLRSWGVGHEKAKSTAENTEVKKKEKVVMYARHEAIRVAKAREAMDFSSAPAALIARLFAGPSAGELPVSFGGCAPCRGGGGVGFGASASAVEWENEWAALEAARAANVDFGGACCAGCRAGLGCDGESTFFGDALSDWFSQDQIRRWVKWSNEEQIRRELEKGHVGPWGTIPAYEGSRNPQWPGERLTPQQRADRMSKPSPPQLQTFYAPEWRRAVMEDATKGYGVSPAGPSFGARLAGRPYLKLGLPRLMRGATGEGKWSTSVTFQVAGEDVTVELRASEALVRRAREHIERYVSFGGADSDSPASLALPAFGAFDEEGLSAGIASAFEHARGALEAEAAESDLLSAASTLKRLRRAGSPGGGRAFAERIRRAVESGSEEAARAAHALSGVARAEALFARAMSGEGAPRVWLGRVLQSAEAGDGDAEEVLAALSILQGEPARVVYDFDAEAVGFPSPDEMGASIVERVRRRARPRDQRFAPLVRKHVILLRQKAAAARAARALLA